MGSFGSLVRKTVWKRVGMLHIALCINDRSGEYYKHGLVTLTSILKNSTCELCFHILHDDTLLANLHHFEHIVQSHQQSIQFHNLEKRDFSEIIPFAAKWGKGALYRLFLHEYIDAERVLYLDCDTVVTTDLQPLLHFNMNGAVIAVVRESAVAKKLREDIRYVKKLGIPPEKYFNSGVILVDLNKLRETGSSFSDAIRENFSAGNSYPDQDALNLYFSKREGQCVFLDEKYNYQVNYASQGAYLQDFAWYNDRILHFATSKKPWKYFSNAALIYWKYYALAFPEENVLEHILATKQHKFTQLCSFVVGSPKMRSLVRRIRDVSTGGPWYAAHKRLFPK